LGWGSAKLAGALAAAAALSLAAPARADDSAAAEALFQQAKQLTEQQRWADACPKFEASYKLDRTLGTLLNLADCEEHVNRVATAWARWGEAVELCQKTADKREAFAAKRRDKLTPRLPMLRIDVPAGKTSLQIYRDGVKIDAAAYGVPLPSDPGSHDLEVRRGDEVLARRSVVARETETTGVPFDLVAIEKAAPKPGQAATVPSVYRTTGYLIGGLGVATIAAAGILEIVALVNKSASNAADACVKNFCTPSGFEDLNRARNFATAGQWVGVAGLVVTAVGLTIVLTAPSGKPAPAVTTSGWLAPGAGGLVLRGAL
jgi:hypothetical protein